MYTPNESSVLGGTAMKETIERYQGDFFDVYTITRMKLYKHELPIENDKEKISRLYGYSFQETESVFELLDKELMELQQVVKNKCNIEIERCKKNIDGNILFIGDQLTSDYLSYFQILRNIFEDSKNINLQSCAVYGSTTNQVIPFLHDSVLSRHPVVVCILIGTNDLLRICGQNYSKNVCSPEEFKRNLEYFIMLLKHYGSKIILNTLPPINESLINKYYSSYGLTAYKKDWDLYNQIIVNIAKTHGCMLNRPDYVLSVKDIIADGNGINLKKEAQCIIAEQILKILECSVQK